VLCSENLRSAEKRAVSGFDNGQAFRWTLRIRNRLKLSSIAVIKRFGASIFIVFSRLIAYFSAGSKVAAGQAEAGEVLEVTC
jgi:hypothetical protein